MRVIFVIQLFLCLTILNLEIIQAQTGNQLALQGIYHYQSMKINESIESLTDALKAGIDDIKLRKDALYYLSKAYLINKNEEMAQKYICQLSQEYPGFEQEETISAHFRELLDQCGQQSAIPQPKHQGISTKKILSYTLLGAGAVCFGLGYNQNKNAQDMQILKYGFKVQKQEINDYILSDSLQTVVDRVKGEVSGHGDPFGAVLVGVDRPWEVCLLKLMVELVQNSVAGNIQDIRQLQRDHKAQLHQQIEQTFLAASRDASKVPELANLLKRNGLFERFEDRFFAVVHASK